MNVVERIIGLDYGSKRIGVSLSDPLGIIASPIDALINDEKLFSHLKELIRKECVKLFVVGMPLNLKGEEAFKAEEVNEFIERLKLEVGIAITTWDERFTTSMAQQTLREMGVKKKDRQKKDGRIDSMAAAIILQDYLNSTKHSRSC